MRRSPLKRGKGRKAGTPLKHGTPMQRGVGLATRTRIRARAATPKRWIVARTDPAYRGWIRGLPCRIVSPACGGPTHPHHVKTRGAGGIDRQNLVPLCAWHHSLLHQIGRKTFATRFGVDLAADAVAFDVIYAGDARRDDAA